METTKNVVYLPVNVQGVNNITLSVIDQDVYFYGKYDKYGRFLWKCHYSTCASQTDNLVLSLQFGSAEMPLVVNKKSKKEAGSSSKRINRDSSL